MKTYKGIIKLVKLGNDRQEWRVRFADAREDFPLHPKDVKNIKELSERFDNIEGRILSVPQVDFKIVSAIQTTVLDDDTTISSTVHYAALEREVNTEYPKIESIPLDEVFDLIESYRLFAHGNGLSADKFQYWWDKKFSKEN